MTIEATLRHFYQRFFEQGNDVAALTLSDFGMLGYSADEPKFKLNWYEALFNWMHGYRKTDLIELGTKIERIRRQNKQHLRNWLPSW